MRSVLENAWADTFLGKACLTFERDSAVDTLLRWFEHELNPAHVGLDPIDSLVGRSPPLHSKRTNLRAYNASLLEAFRNADTDWADDVRLQDLSFSAQRVALFLRAIVKRPDIVILDEAFSGMDVRTRTKCMMFLAYGETRWITPKSSLRSQIPQPQNPPLTMTDANLRTAYVKAPTRLTTATKTDVNFGPFESRQALVVVAHRREEVPPLVSKWMCLPEAGAVRPALRMGEISVYNRPADHMGAKRDWWRQVWGEGLRYVVRTPARRSYRYEQ